jgi:transposase
MVTDQSYAATEARGLLCLLKNGESVQSVRALIGGSQSDYRMRVRRQFDLLVARLPRHGNGERLRHNVDTTAISEELKSEVRKLLHAGWSQRRISKYLPVGRFLVEQLSKEIGASLSKRGRGKRLSAEQKQEITERLKADVRSIDVARQFGIDPHTVLKFRRALGGSTK